MNWLPDLIRRLSDFFKDIPRMPLEKPAPFIPQPIPNPEPIIQVPTPSQRLYDIALSKLHTDASPKDLASDDLACMETVDQLHFDAFGIYISGMKKKITLSTQDGYIIMNNSPLFQRVDNPEPGCIIISPSGYGNGRLAHGHVGIVGKFHILSNNSATGLLDDYYTLETWKDRYKGIGGFPVVFFKRV